MSEDCIFCSIVAGDISARTVYEDEDVLAFLDANPLSPGHTLVIPKDHHERLQDVPDEPVELLMAAIHHLTPIVEDTVDANGSNIGFNNGPAAGQEVPHVHGHIIPRFEGDGGAPIHAVAGDRPDFSDEELDDLADQIAGAAGDR